MPTDKMWLERKRTLNYFWDKWQADYIATLSIDKKWLGDDTKIKPGDVVILKRQYPTVEACSTSLWLIHRSAER